MQIIAQAVYSFQGLASILQAIVDLEECKKGWFMFFLTVALWQRMRRYCNSKTDIKKEAALSLFP